MHGGTPMKHSTNTRMVPQNENGTMRRRLCRWLDVPDELADGGLRLDMRGRCSLTVHACRRIVAFSPTSIVLAIPTGTLTVTGQDLLCTAYLAGAVGVEGWVCGITFCDGSDGEAML